ncbi:NAD(P)-dependent oxidoreductase [Leuconostoc pseudomesenteroides]|uniref:NAD(P)-dependent oxidoreductase n=1 Tax=Leuconostoc pseudomesenteroides TaxID=33968 RepID=UPI0021A99D81|nr:NAD(P)-dependent oxidoreductase [Leuconostoc pseudomesenteroides]MCT4388731.1 NAD(P)-dependent oxidoreductase [Leuconostoc pseudomesenteroides]
MFKIGFIGTGVMGTAMIKNLITANYEVSVFNRTKSHAEEAINYGAHWMDSPAKVSAVSDIIITMVGFPKDVEEVYLGEDGIIAQLKPNQIILDMSTSSPSLSKQISDAAHEMGGLALDAPVTGGDIGARKGTLTIMVGGDKEAYDKTKDILHKLGSSVVYFGKSGNGQHVKLINQIMIAGTMTGLTESYLYANAAGIDPESVFKTIGQGAAQNWSMDNYIPRILNNDYTPGFFAKHFLKDLRLALDESDKLGLDLRATEQAKRLYEIMVDVKNLGNLGTQGLFKIY